MSDQGSDDDHANLGASDDDRQDTNSSSEDDHITCSNDDELSETDKPRKKGYFSNWTFPQRWLNKVLKFLGQAHLYQKREFKVKHHLVIVVQQDQIIVEGSDEIRGVAIDTGFVHMLVQMADDSQACNHKEFVQSKFSDRLSLFIDKRQISSVLNSIGFNKISADYRAAHKRNPEEAKDVLSPHMSNLLHKRVRLDHKDRSLYFSMESYKDAGQCTQHSSTSDNEGGKSSIVRSKLGKFQSQNEGKTISIHELLLLLSSKHGIAHGLVATFVTMENAQEGVVRFSFDFAHSILVSIILHQNCIVTGDSSLQCISLRICCLPHRKLPVCVVNHHNPI